ncbi:tigger transposable element-derived protein 4-like [Ornithodoros turicata]|uniref:tigger transposable element-derived protein 4-like n=1 Tax=Ornithodoros turicata TaxID=34597 RepID=UPI003139C15E
MSTRAKYKTLSSKEKLTAIDEVESGLKKTVVLTKYGIAKSTIAAIMNSKDKIRGKAHGFTANRKRLREAAHPRATEALLLWLKRARSSNIPVSGPILQAEANELAERLGHADFKCSNGWISRFKERHGLVFKAVSGEEAAGDPSVVTNWQAMRLQTVLREYAPCDVYNADELGLFFKCLPSQTLCRRGERCTGGKLSKERVTVMVCSNMDGSHKTQLFVIRKVRRPRCFKGVRTLPVAYAANSCAWTTQELFKQWLRKLDLEFKCAKRNVVLVIDNCPAHGCVEGLEAIKLEMLPPNTTASLHPMDQGVIQNLKVNYRRLLLQRMLLYMDNNMAYDVTLLSAIGMLSEAWEASQHH